MAAAPWIVSEELWELIEPLLPRKERRFRYPGRKRLSERQALQRILFVLFTGVAWQHLLAELGFGSGVTCWRRLDEWQRAGVWERLHELLLTRLRAARDRVGAGDRRLKPGAGEKGGSATGPSPVEEAVPAPSTISSSTKSGLALAFALTGSNRNDVTPAGPAP
jgi:transposase